MSGTTITIKTEIKDPSARLDYTWDWTRWLLGADTITNVTIAAIVDDGALTIGTPVIVDGAIVTVMIEGGTLGKTYLVTAHITTSEGREDERSRRLVIKER